MNIKGNLVHWFGVVALLGSGVGCGAPEGTESAGEQDLGTTEQKEVLRYHGGGGGRPFTLPYASYAYDGFYNIRTGSFVDQVTFRYFYPMRYTDSVGRGGGSDRGAHTCSNWMIGIFGRSGSYVDQLGIICGNADHSGRYTIGPWGGNSGDYFYDECPTGQMVKQVMGRSGDYLDGIQINCG
jgi:hypothetical protein